MVIKAMSKHLFISAFLFWVPIAAQTFFLFVEVEEKTKKRNCCYWFFNREINKVFSALS
jgi:hypothetical protein